MKQYPDSIVIDVKQGGGQDANGDWLPSTITSYRFDCRAEVNSSGRRLVNADGTTMDYTMICYAPLLGEVDYVLSAEDGSTVETENNFNLVISTVVASLMRGTEGEYTLTNRLGDVYKGHIKRAFVGQLNTRLWL